MLFVWHCIIWRPLIHPFKLWWQNWLRRFTTRTAFFTRLQGLMIRTWSYMLSWCHRITWPCESKILVQVAQILDIVMLRHGINTFQLTVHPAIECPHLKVELFLRIIHPSILTVRMVHTPMNQFICIAVTLLIQPSANVKVCKTVIAKFSCSRSSVVLWENMLSWCHRNHMSNVNPKF